MRSAVHEGFMYRLSLLLVLFACSSSPTGDGNGNGNGNGAAIDWSSNKVQLTA
jgi:hypothetical protein